MTINAKGITFKYQGEDRPIFEDLYFSMEGPGFFSLFGLSGTGKSTLGRIISGLLEPNEGRVERSTGTRTILYTHNEERLPNWEPVARHLEKVTPRQGQEVFLRFKEVALSGIDLHCRFSGLSLGQKNRVNFARYVVQDFDCLIIDETLSNVDEPTRERILAFLKEEFPRRTFLYISHHVKEVARFSKEVFVLPWVPGRPIKRLHEIMGLDEKAPVASDLKSLKELGIKILRKAAEQSIHERG